MELRHLRYFLAVAEARNFTRAAATLGIGQPPLSQQIRDLETELGVQLFHRVPHGAELTEAGQAFAEEARVTLASADRARLAAQQAGRGETGRLALAFTGSAAFNPAVSGVIHGFRRQWPRVRLSLDESNTARMLEGLDQGRLDAAFLRPGRDGLDGLQLRPMPDEPMLAALPADHGLASRERLTLSSLAQEPFVLFPRSGSLSLHAEVLLACREAGFEPKLGQEAPQIASAINLVAAGLGVSIVPASTARIRLDSVVFKPLDPPAPVARLALAYRRGPVSPLIRNLLALLPV